MHMCCLQVCVCARARVHLCMHVCVCDVYVYVCMYVCVTFCLQVLHRRVPQLPPLLLARWVKGHSKGQVSKGQVSFGLREVAIRHIAQAAEANLELLHAVGIITRTCELSRMFGMTCDV